MQGVSIIPRSLVVCENYDAEIGNLHSLFPNRLLITQEFSLFAGISSFDIIVKKSKISGAFVELGIATSCLVIHSVIYPGFEADALEKGFFIQPQTMDNNSALRGLISSFGLKIVLIPVSDIAASQICTLSRQDEDSARQFLRNVPILFQPAQTDSHSKGSMIIRSANHQLLNKQVNELVMKRRNYIASLPPPPVIQSLQISVFHKGEDRMAVANTRMPIRFETDLFEGACLVLLRTSPMDSFYRHIFEGKKRMCEVQVQGRFKKPMDPSSILVGFEISHRMELGLVTRSLCSGILRFLRSFQTRLHHSFGDMEDEELPHMVMPWYNGVERLVVTAQGDVPPPLGISFHETLDSVDRRRKTDPSKLADFINTTSVYSFSLHTQFIDMCEWDLLNLPMISRMDLKTFWQDSCLRMVVYSVTPEIIADPYAKHLNRDNEYLFLLKLKNIQEHEMDGEMNARMEKAMTLFSGRVFANNSDIPLEEQKMVDFDVALSNRSISSLDFDSPAEFEDEKPWWKYPHPFSFCYYNDAVSDLSALSSALPVLRSRSIRFHNNDDNDLYEDSVIGMKQTSHDSREDLAALDLRIAMDLTDHQTNIRHSQGDDMFSMFSMDSDESSGDDFVTVIGSLEKIMDDDDDDENATFNGLQVDSDSRAVDESQGNTNAKKGKLLSRLVTKLKAANVERKRIKQLKKEKKIQDRETKKKLKDKLRGDKGKGSLLGLRKNKGSSMQSKNDETASNNSADYYDAVSRSDHDESGDDDDDSLSKTSPTSTGVPDLSSIAHFQPTEDVPPPCLKPSEARTSASTKLSLSDLSSDIHTRVGDVPEMGLGKIGKEWFFQRSQDAISFLVDHDLSYTAASIDIIDCRYGSQEAVQMGSHATTTKKRREVYLFPIPQSYQRLNDTVEGIISRPFRKKFVLRSFSEFCTSLPLLGFTDFPDEKRVQQEEKRRRNLSITMKILYYLSTKDRFYAELLQNRLLYAANTQVEDSFMHLRGPPCLVLSPEEIADSLSSSKTSGGVSAIRSFDLPDVSQSHPSYNIIGRRASSARSRSVVYFESTVCVALDRRRWSEQRMFISSEKRKLGVCKASGEANESDAQNACLFSFDLSDEILGFRPLFSHEVPFEGVWMFQVSTFAKVFYFFVLSNQELLWWMVALQDCVSRCNSRFLNVEQADSEQFSLTNSILSSTPNDTEEDFVFVSNFHSSELHSQVPALADPTRVLAKPGCRVLGAKRVLNFRRTLFRTPYRLLAWNSLQHNGPAITRFTSKLALLSSKLRQEKLETWLSFMDHMSVLQTLNLQSIPAQFRLLVCLNIAHAAFNHSYNVVIPPSTWSSWPSYYNNMSIMIGNDVVSLSEFEHCVIRKTMARPSSLFGRISVPQTSFLFSCSLQDFRTNLIINCGSISLPQTAYCFTATDFDQEMDDACKKSVQATVDVDIESKTITIPKSCDWFEDDFSTLIIPEPSQSKSETHGETKTGQILRKDSFHVNISHKQYCVRRLFPYLTSKQKQDLLSISASKPASSKKLTQPQQSLPAANDVYWESLKVEYRNFSFRIRTGGIDFYQDAV